MSDYFNEKEPREFKGRVIFATILVAAAFCGLAVRLWYLQIKEGEYYLELAENNRIRSVKSTAPRGTIYDRLGIKLVENRPGFDLYLVPEDVKDWTKTKNLLRSLIGIEPQTIDEKLELYKSRPPFQAVKLKEDLSWEETVKVESFKFEMPGVMLDVTPKRHYIYGEATAHLIGYLGEINEKELKDLKARKYSPGDFIGKYGLEKTFESDLRGIDGSKNVEVDALGRKMGVVNVSPPYPGNDIQLTIDIRTQVAAWAALQGKAGAAIAIEPSTGKVLALVSTPGFDPNALSSGISREDWKDLTENPLNILMNRVLQAQYPPASTFKPLHASAALEENVITPSTLIHSGPSFWFAGREYRDWKKEGHGTINVHRAIVESSDTFFYQVGLRMGVDRIANYAKGFGFGSKTGIELGGEKSGNVPSTAWKRAVYKVPWYDGETISVSVGQGYMLTTPLQLASAYAAIANGSTLYVPKIVEEIKTPSGKVLKEFYPEKRGTILVSGASLAFVKDALRGVVEEDGGTAHFLKAAGLKIAGKTGTAQVARLIKRTKNVESIAYKVRDHAWFAGYAPYDDPKIAVVVLVEHGGFGASSAAPVAREIFKAYLAPESSPVIENVKGGVEPGAARAIQQVAAPTEDAQDGEHD